MMLSFALAMQGRVAEALVRQSVEKVQECLRSEKKLEDLLLEAYRALPPPRRVETNSSRPSGMQRGARSS